MSQNEQEVEVKFYITHLPALRQRLTANGAELIQPRVHELNLRYDMPDGSLSRAHRVLRLRQDQRAIMTYKGPAEVGQPVTVRQEIEVEVSNFTAAAHLLEALGYQMIIMYEKQRTTYSLKNVRVTFDEMPYGNFIEIEGPNADAIRVVADMLNLDWETRVLESYLQMFARLRDEKQLKVRNLSFEDFKGIEITAADLGIKAADLAGSSQTFTK